MWQYCHSRLKYKTDVMMGIQLYFPPTLEQIEVEASDQGVPPRVASTTVTVTVSQDSNLPTFNQTEYTATLPEDMAVGDLVVQVDAYDLDVSVNIE